MANWKLQKVVILGSYVVSRSCLCLTEKQSRNQWRGYRGALFRPNNSGGVLQATVRDE
ncbi:uncharacterized protein CTRU02_200460 [Colletotrichum truncatum]|uniref:Uncharacterized protein n=1 Tax=Colletotrichum truncatum TaxID=5467 RepID=A0ACC3ZER5_COLTU|nr:uncharacterized protein CTRU02_00221 [Colletotrichum truncatum]KAF6801471.1 hypothetical protein CTRU02_00221 [Colletotrichum truncatum]